MTASPTRNWRLRFGASTQDGVIETTKAYDQRYNDQFYANAAGQVTYRNGTVVYVNGGAANAAQYENKLGKASLHVRNVLGAPDVLVVEEVENLQVVEALAARIPELTARLAAQADVVMTGAPERLLAAYQAEKNTTSLDGLPGLPAT